VGTTQSPTYPMDNVGYFHGGKQMWCKTDHIAEVKNECRSALIPAYVLMACTWTTSLLFKFGDVSNEWEK
jgi:hypothetical protein